MATSSSIALVGVGAIGGAVIADLADLGRHHLQLCARTPFESLEVEHPAGQSRVDAPVLTDPGAVQPVDWILLATKAYQSEDARPWLDALTREGSVVAVLQNGVDHEARIQPLVSSDVEVLPVVVRLPAVKKAAGYVHQEGPGGLIVPDSASGVAFVELFTGGRLRVRASDDFLTQKWLKLMNNAARGAVSTLTLRPLAVAEDTGVQDLVLELMEEVAAVARAEGANIAQDVPSSVLAALVENASGHFSSITIDRLEGRRLEWQVRNAVVGKRGRVHGIATPMNDAMTALMRAVDGQPIPDPRAL